MRYLLPLLLALAACSSNLPECGLGRVAATCPVDAGPFVDIGAQITDVATDATEDRTVPMEVGGARDDVAPAGCTTGYADCDGNSANGCEAALATSNAHCGACGVICGGRLACLAGTCQSAVLESFEAEGWPWAPWNRGAGLSAGDSNVVADCAHNGARGLNQSSRDARWYYRTDRIVGEPGQKISLWVRSVSSGVAHLGFGASASGAWSFMLSVGGRRLGFVRHDAWEFRALDVAPTTPADRVWYRMEVTFGTAGRVTGTVYDAAGTIVASFPTTIPGLTTGGVGFYGSATCIDTLEVR